VDFFPLFRLTFFESYPTGGERGKHFVSYLDFAGDSGPSISGKNACCVDIFDLPGNHSSSRLSFFV
jgi:hypothetical protein